MALPEYLRGRSQVTGLHIFNSPGRILYVELCGVILVITTPNSRNTTAIFRGYFADWDKCSSMFANVALFMTVWHTDSSDVLPSLKRS